MSQFDYKQFYGRNLPHIQPPNATLFVTFRLANSIPQTVLEEWMQEKKQLEAEHLRRESVGSTPLDSGINVEEKKTFQRHWFAKFETLLHADATGPTWLKEERVATIVREALHYRDGKVYRLDAFCIMPNHVHIVFAPLMTEAAARKLAESAWRRAKYRKKVTHDLIDNKKSVLAVIMQSLKGYTARQCNLALGRNGEFWQHESFDHVVCDEAEFDRILNYVLHNPVKARLISRWQDWKWNYCCPSLVERL